MLNDDLKQFLMATAGSVIRHGMTVAAGGLVAHHILNANQQASFVDIETSLALGGLALVWSVVKKYIDQYAGDDGA